MMGQMNEWMNEWIQRRENTQSMLQLSERALLLKMSLQCVFVVVVFFVCKIMVHPIFPQPDFLGPNRSEILTKDVFEKYENPKVLIKKIKGPFNTSLNYFSSSFMRIGRCSLSLKILDYLLHACDIIVI